MMSGATTAAKAGSLRISRGPNTVVSNSRQAAKLCSFALHERTTRSTFTSCVMYM